MSLRDLFLFGVLFALIVTIPRRPIIGAYAWVVFGVMNPHRLSWGAAYDFPFSAVIAGLTVVGIVFTKEKLIPKGGGAIGVLIAFAAWMCVTQLFAFEPDLAYLYLTRVLKIFVMTFVLMLVLKTRRHVDILIWTLVCSIGFYGVKGGIFVIATGGQFMVNGPDGSAIAGNNSLGVGLVVVIPLMYYLMQQSSSRKVRLGLLGAMALCSISVLGSYSRGALLGVLAMGILMWWRGRNKLWVAIGFAVFVAVAIPAMPSAWMDRMYTIKTYDSDDSAVGRLVAWETAYNIAKDRFPVAGGFDWASPATSAKYSPVPTTVLVAHSIYFQVIGAQGFIGLLLFLGFWWAVWLQCVWLRRQTRGRPELAWAHMLASMTQVSLVGFAVGGAFLDIAFWDLPYYLYAGVAVTLFVVREATKPTSAVPLTGVGLPAPAGSAVPGGGPVVS